ncbi:MAG: hypothetical protein WCL54_05010 [Clostridia bacterium]
MKMKALIVSFVVLFTYFFGFAAFQKRDPFAIDALAGASITTD